MDENDKLKLIKTPAALGESNNFWQACPKKLDYLPETNCDKGTPTVNANNGKIQEEPECAWWINSEEHNYCFWRYLQDKSGPDGVMQELVQSDLANLFGWSNTKTHFMLKQAIDELTDALKLYGALELISELDQAGLDVVIDSIEPDDPYFPSGE